MKKTYTWIWLHDDPKAKKEGFVDGNIRNKIIDEENWHLEGQDSAWHYVDIGWVLYWTEE